MGFKMNTIKNIITNNNANHNSIDFLSLNVNHRIEINDNNLPSIDWENTRIQLYDLSKDPYENNNIAYRPENKELVEELVKEFREMVQNSSPTYIAGLYTLSKFAKVFDKVFIVLMITVFGISTLI